MKFVLNNQAVAHAWAHQTQGHARNSTGAISFSGNSIHSYRAEIGRILPDGTYALASRSWSMVTNQHQSDVRRAIPQGAFVIRVYELGDVPGVIGQHERMARQLVERAATARTRRQHYLAEAQLLIDSADQYSQAHGYSQRCDKSIMPSGQDLENIKAFIAKRDREQAEKAEKLEREVAEHLAESIERWRGFDSGISAYMIRRAPCALRIRGDAVETSHGAEVPLDHAVRLWPIVCKVRASGKARDSLTVRVGHYTLSKISEAGDIVVGCHRIAFTELERIAQQLNLTAETASA